MSATSSIYRRLATRAVQVGGLTIGNYHPIRIQTMTTTDTMDTDATVAQTIRCIQAGAELVRITAPSKKEAENLRAIKDAVRAAGYQTPLVADIHFTPNAAEIAAAIVEKVRVNPGNYVDKKKFDQIDYTDAEYAAEIDRIRSRFTPLVRICKMHGTAMRIGTNHGSLSDRIMSRYGDTHTGMVESAMEFLRIAREENYHEIILSMKSSNPLVMVQAYRLLVQQMLQEFGECYPLHLGVTEAGDGEDGRIKSAIGIGTLLEEGIGDTIRVSLTEDPEFEVPVCADLVKHYPEATSRKLPTNEGKITVNTAPYQKRLSTGINNIGGGQVPVVTADYMNTEDLHPQHLESIGYRYDSITDKWHINDGAADYIFTGNQRIDFKLPGTLTPVINATTWINLSSEEQRVYKPLWELADYHPRTSHPVLNFVNLDWQVKTLDLIQIRQLLLRIKEDKTVVLCLSAYDATYNLLAFRDAFAEIKNADLPCPVILVKKSGNTTVDKQLIDFSVATGGLLLDGLGDGLWLRNEPDNLVNTQVSGRTYLVVSNNHQFLNSTAFSILQASRTRISKTEYISCPSCGRTLFDLQETTAKIRAATHHLKGLKIAIMGCIVNGPGEMADADFGYVGSGPGKITLYKGREVMKRNVPSEIAVQELIELLKENDVWV